MNPAKGEVIAEGDAGVEGIRCLRFDKTGSWFATCGGGNLVRIWSYPSLQIEAVLSDHQDEVMAVSWNPTDGRLASVDRAGVVWIWNVELRQGTLRLQETVGALLGAAGRVGNVALWE